MLYIKDASGTPYYSRTAWGYCDGKSIFIMRDGFLCPAWKEGSAFYFYSVFEQLHMVEGGTVGPTYEVKEKVHNIYALDMDTGNAY